MKQAKTERARRRPGLVRVDDGMPGIVRMRRGSGFAYRAADGHWLDPRRAADRPLLERIRRLAIPPAYRSVWICPLDNGHLQATGRDARGRKQYRYHTQWHEARGDDKFDRMLDFGRALPRLRRRVARDLRAVTNTSSLHRTALLASLVRLLDTTLVRVGNEAYARENQSYGLTTLRNRHARVNGAQVKLRFKGKSGVMHEVSMSDRRVAAIVRRCQALPGQALFQYEDAQGMPHSIDSADVNAYIREAAGEAFSAKDFRTWHATAQAWALLCPGSQTGPVSARAMTRVLAEVASRLGNTPAVCRKSYVHRGLLRCASSNEWPDMTGADGKASGLSVNEQGLMRFLIAWETWEK
jgi:DNA topoisomerase-1